MVGKEVTVGEVMEVVLKDRKFYDNSGGGVTLSGGDPVAQPDFAMTLLRSCREESLHTVIETCGYAQWDVMEMLLEYTDMVLFDIKCINEEKHIQGTTVSNRQILENAKKISRLKSMLVRVPLIPDLMTCRRK